MDKDEWKQAKDKNGRVYYYNIKTGQSSWSKPAIKQNQNADNKSQNTVDLKLLEKHGWRVAKSKDGRNYYYNTKSKETRWDPPEIKVDIPPNTTVKASKSEEISKPQEERKHTDASEGLFAKYGKNSRLTSQRAISREEAENLFMQMLKDNHVDSTWSFSEIISKIGTKDSRYWLIDNDPLWKQQMFEKYLANRSEDELLKETNEVNKFHDAFVNMLSKQSDIHYYTRWKTAKNIISNESIYIHSPVNENIKKKVYMEYIATLLKKHNDVEENIKERALEELQLYLEDIIVANEDTFDLISWPQLCDNYLFEKSKRYQSNKNFKILTHEDVLKMYIEIVKTREIELKEKMNKIDKINYTKDRIARDNFKKLLNDKNTYIIRANTKWSDVFPFYKNNELFLNLVGRNGSLPLDLFYDIIEEKNDIINGLRSIAQQLLIDKEYKWDDEIDEVNESNLENLIEKNGLHIKDILSNDGRFKNIESEDIDIIISRICQQRIDKALEKIEMEKQLNAKKEYHFKMLLQSYYRNQLQNLKTDKWEDIRDKLKTNKEYIELSKNEEVPKQIFNDLQQEVLSSSTMSSITNNPSESKTGIASKKRTISSAMELDY